MTLKRRINRLSRRARILTETLVTPVTAYDIKKVAGDLDIADFNLVKRIKSGHIRVKQINFNGKIPNKYIILPKRGDQVMVRVNVVGGSNETDERL